jgi:hypothetical protein
MKKGIYANQSNTREGLFPIVAAMALAGLSDLLVLLGEDGVELPSGRAALTPFLLLEGAAEGADATVLPLTIGENVRIRAKGTGSKGDVLVLAAPGVGNADAGKVAAYNDETGVLFSPGIAEEDFVDGQLVLTRPLPRYVGGIGEGAPIAFTGAAPAATAATSSTPFGFAQAQADALVANVREMRSALIAKGIMAANA